MPSLISGIILASGFSRRMPHEKLLLPFGNGTIVERVIQAATGSVLDEVLFVYHNEAVAAKAAAYNIPLIYNKQAGEGQSASIRTGVVSTHPESEAYLFMVGDQPFLEPSVINRIIEEHHERPEQIIVPVYADKRGTPTIFPSLFRDELLALRGDCGGRRIIERFPESVRTVPVDAEGAGFDIDTVTDYEQSRNLLD